MRVFRLTFLVSAAVCLFWGMPADAQMFGSPSQPAASSYQTGNWKTNAQRYGTQSKQPSAVQQPVKKTEESESSGEKAWGAPLMPTKDGSKRGGVAIQMVGSDGSPEETNFIFLYYTNFSVNKTIGGEVRCDVRFVMTTTLDRKLNSLGVKLKWPKMETALSFNDVIPNVDAYVDYTLVGEGCYSMDKIPNIIVNRCRVAKMSQEECAAKIRWLRKR